jgi:alpha-L-rhamnosidase
MCRIAAIGKTVQMFAVASILMLTLQAQQIPTPLDPSRQAGSLLRHPPLNHLREQFIWTRGDAAALNPELQSKVRGQDQKIAPHYFRSTFDLTSVPRQATLYLAGPRSATVYLNGRQVLQFIDNGHGEKGFHVDTADVASSLRRGRNIIAVEEVRGHSSLHTGASRTINQVTYAEVLLAKIVPRPLGVFAPSIVATDAAWKSTLIPGRDWVSALFDDTTWPTVQTLGVPGAKSDFLQWNSDAGLYAWPGYSGVSAAMRTFRIPVASVAENSSSTRIPHPEAIQHGGSLTVLPSVEKEQGASLVLDFGREINGRIHLVSASDTLIPVETSYGESVEEAIAHPYLGSRTMNVPPHGEAFGPKSGFRYVHLTFPSTASNWKSIDVEGITYPVQYLGAFESSDTELNRIWETGAYTAHLCMQEGIWDAPKRDRGRWMGDLDVTGRVISSIFADRKLMEETMTQVIGDSPVKRDVNTITGYSALWITGQANFYRHLGDIEYLTRMHGRLLDLLHLMDTELNEVGLFTNAAKHKVFVDWSTGLNADTPEARAATHLEFVAAYREAAYLLEQVGDAAHAKQYRQAAERLRAAAQESLVSRDTGTFGDRWQTNAMAIVSGAATSAEKPAVWKHVLSHVNDDAATAVVTPYYGYYILSAMAALDHRPEALAWMRKYWGGMLAEGATSFWEAYDPHWPREDFHASLEADNKKGYYVSLAHGWASGPTAWLMEQVLGIEPTGRGFETVAIRPDLAGLAWVHGAEPTPRGLIRIDVTPAQVRINLPPGTRATVVLPFALNARTILDNGRPVRASSAEDGERAMVMVVRSGIHVFSYRENTQL